MNALSLINPAIPTLNPHTAVQEAQTTLLSYHMYEVPVVDKGIFMGFFGGLSSSDKLPAPASPVRDHLYNRDCYVEPQVYYYDIVKKSLLFDNHSVAVCESKGQYLGAIRTGDIVKAFGLLSATQSPGGLIVIMVRTDDYALAEVIRLIEESGTKVLSLHVLQDPDKDHHIQLHIKTHTQETQPSIETLKRFGYSVLEGYDAEAHQDAKRNYDLLMRYLSD